LSHHHSLRGVPSDTPKIPVASQSEAFSARTSALGTPILVWCHISVLSSSLGFWVFGDGSEKVRLSEALETVTLSNDEATKQHPPMSWAPVVAIVQNVFVDIAHLRRLAIPITLVILYDAERVNLEISAS